MDTYIIDLEEERENLLEDIDTVDEELADLKERASGIPEDERSLSDEFANIEEEWEQTQEVRASLKGQMSALEDAIGSWEGTEITCRELTYGTIQRARDNVSKKSYEVDSSGDATGVPRQGYYQLHILELSITEMPPGAPDDPRELHHHVGEILFERVDEYNTTGDFEMAKNSLREELGMST